MELIEKQAAIDAVGLNTWAGSRISKLPTVEAIPVEWLEKWFTEKHKRAIIWWDCAEGVFKAFMEDWRKENG